jgi:hypothetical protein
MREFLTEPRWSSSLLVTGIVMGFFIGALIGLHLGAAYGYNLTEQQKQEEKFLPYCYNNDHLVIETLKQYCAEIYGGPVP